MTATSARALVSVAALTALLCSTWPASDAQAREPRFSGGATRSAGSATASRTFSRQGAASAGSLSSGRRAQANGNVTSNQATRRESATSRTSSNQDARQGAISDNQQARQSAMSDQQQSRQSAASANQERRQDTVSQNVDVRQENYYHNEHDDDDWDTGSAAVGFVAGAVVGSVVTSAASQSAPAPASTTVVYTSPPALTTLPCAPEILGINGVTYYRCGQAYYIQAYGASGPFYTPVQPPPM